MVPTAVAEIAIEPKATDHPQAGARDHRSKSTLRGDPRSPPAFYWHIETCSAAQLAKGKHDVVARAPSIRQLRCRALLAPAAATRPEIWSPGEAIPEAALDLNCPWVVHHERVILEAKLVSQLVSRSN
jgi:hypothetical protein